MKNVILTIRIAAIFALSFVAVIAILGNPDDNMKLGEWMVTFFVSKAIGASAIIGILFLWGGTECVKAFFKGIFKDELQSKYANNRLDGRRIG